MRDLRNIIVGLIGRQDKMIADHKSMEDRVSKARANLSDPQWYPSRKDYEKLADYLEN